MRKPDGWDFVVMLGIVSLEVGLWLWSPALALVVLGLLLMVLGVIGYSWGDWRGG